MEERIKERLTGAAILVVIVVLLVPEMFRGERVAAPSPVKPEPGTPPLRSYTIELDGMSAAGNGPPAAVSESPANAAPAVSPAPVAPAPVVIAAASKPAPASSGNKSAAEKPAAEKPPGEKSGSDRPASDRASGEWVVQVATFSQRENAARLVQQAAKKGARLMVAGPDGRGMYRVRSVAQSTRQAAAVLQARLKAQGYSGMVSAAN